MMNLKIIIYLVLLDINESPAAAELVYGNSRVKCFHQQLGGGGGAKGQK